MPLVILYAIEVIVAIFSQILGTIIFVKGVHPTRSKLHRVIEPSISTFIGSLSETIMSPLNDSDSLAPTALKSFTLTGYVLLAGVQSVDLRTEMSLNVYYRKWEKWEKFRVHEKLEKSRNKITNLALLTFACWESRGFNKKFSNTSRDKKFIFMLDYEFSICKHFPSSTQTPLYCCSSGEKKSFSNRFLWLLF